MVSDTVVMSTPSGTTLYHSSTARGGTGVGKITPTCSRHPVMPSAMLLLLLRTRFHQDHCRIIGRSLRDFSAGRGDDLAPFLGVRRHHRKHLLGRASDHIQTLLAQAILESPIG